MHGLGLELEKKCFQKKGGSKRRGISGCIARKCCTAKAFDGECKVVLTDGA